VARGFLSYIFLFFCKHDKPAPRGRKHAPAQQKARHRYRSTAKDGRIVRSCIRRMPVPKTTQNAAKKRPVPTKRSPVIKSVNTSASPGSGDDDDINVMALRLAPGKLSPEMAAYFSKCEEKLGFVPNVLKAFAFDDAKLQAFVDYRHELVQNAANLSKLEIEMIATAASAQNRCFYCITAHGNAVRQLGSPVLGEMMVMNYRAARLDKRQRAMLDFAVKLTTQPWEIEEEDRERLRRAGFTDRDIWDIASVAAFYNMTNRLASATDMRPNGAYHGQAR
jgi:uncharacterized peroxidase-related enzyme